MAMDSKNKRQWIAKKKATSSRRCLLCKATTHLFDLPPGTDDWQKKLWCDFANVQEWRGHHRLCALHFESEFLPPSNWSLKKIRLKKNAVPTLKQCSVDVKNVVYEPVLTANVEGTQVDVHIDEVEVNLENETITTDNFDVPKDEPLRKKWEEAIGPELKKGITWTSPVKHVCSAHFEETLIDRFSYPSGHYIKVRRGAVPSLNLKPPDDQISSEQDKQHFEQVVVDQPPTEDQPEYPAQPADPLQEEDPLQTKDPLSESPPPAMEPKMIILETANEKTPSNLQRSAKPKIIHKEPGPVVKIVCEICDEVFRSSAKFRTHRITAHESLLRTELTKSSLTESSPALANRPPALTNCSPAPTNRPQALKNHSPALTNCPPALKNLSPALTNHPPALKNHSPALTNRPPALKNLSPALTNRPPALKNHSPALTNRSPALTKRSPTVETAGSEKTSVLQPALASVDDIMDEVIRDKSIGAKPSANSSYVEASSDLEKDDESSQDVICLGPVAEKPPASAAAAASAASPSYEPRQDVVYIGSTDFNIRPSPRPTQRIMDIEETYLCDICEKTFMDRKSFSTHMKVHDLQSQWKTPRTSKRPVEKPQLPKTPLTDTASVNHQNTSQSSAKELEPNVGSQSKELVEAKKIIQVLYQKMRTLLQENERLRAIIKKSNPNFHSGKEKKRKKGNEVTKGLKDLDDMILSCAEGSFLEKLDLSQIEKLGNVTSLVIEEDGTLSERSIGGPLVGPRAPRVEIIPGAPEVPSTNQVIQIEAEETQTTDDAPRLKVERCTDLDTDALFEVTTPEILSENAPKKLEKESGDADRGSLQEVENDPLEGIGTFHTDVTSSVNSTGAPSNGPKHACGMCGHRTATQEEMLEHISSHIGAENNEEVDEDEGIPDVEETVMFLTGDLTTQPETFPTTSVHQTDEAQPSSTQESHVDSEECTAKCAPPKRKQRKRLRPMKFFCDLCDYRCRYPNEMVSHKLFKHDIHTETAESLKNLLCGVCDYRTENSANMRRHLATHSTGVKKFACDQCDYRTGVKWYLDQHKIIHNGPLPKTHKCDLCSYATTTRRLLNTHKKRIHKIVTARPGVARNIKCEICDKTFTHRGTYRMHMTSHDCATPLTKLPELTCELCYKKVTGWGPFRRHKEACERDSERVIIDLGDPDNQVFACRGCGQRFSSHEGGLAHKCPQPSRFHCSVCEFSCKLKPQLVTHMMVHTGEKPFECSVCQTRFRQHPHLVVHMRTHTGEKPFPCRHCGKRFAARQNMQAHERLHTGEKPHECTFCDFQTREKRSLKKHMQTHHYEEEDSGFVMEDM